MSFSWLSSQCRPRDRHLFPLYSNLPVPRSPISEAQLHIEVQSPLQDQRQVGTKGWFDKLDMIWRFQVYSIGQTILEHNEHFALPLGSSHAQRNHQFTEAVTPAPILLMLCHHPFGMNKASPGLTMTSNPSLPTD